MVTRIENRQSINDFSPKSKSDTEAKVKTLTGKTNELVTAAIKGRTESFGVLCQAAAHAAFLGIVHSRWEQFNRLFNKLPAIDSEALRQKFMLRVNDKYAVDGTRDTDADGNEIDTWIKRPTTMISFVAKPQQEGQHFSLASAADSGDKAEAKRKLINAYREKVEAAGVDDLAAIEWQSRAKVLAAPAVYDVSNFKKRLSGLLSTFLKEGGNDPENGINKAYVEGIMRAAAFDKPQLSLVRLANPAVMIETTPKAETPRETPQEDSRAAA
jgi:hypothetical protein